MDEQKPRESPGTGAPAATSESAHAKASSDVVLIHGVTPDGGGLQVIRARDSMLEAGTVYPLREGQPVHGDIVRLKPRGLVAPQSPTPAHAPERQHPTPADSAGSHGPSDPTATEPSPALLCDVEVLVRNPGQLRAAPVDLEGTRSKGPAKVSNEAYRTSWERIFGGGGGGTGSSGSSAPN